MNESLLIFLVKLAFISVSAEQQTLCPRRRAAHLLAYRRKRHARIGFNDKLIVDVHHHGAIPECLHGITQNVTGGRLYDIFDELRPVGFEPFPFLCAADAFIGNAVAAELVFTDARFYIGKVPAGWERDKELR